MPSKWSKEAVVQQILALHKSGEKLNSWHVQKNYPHLSNASQRYWGGWKQAVKGAGLDYDDVRITQRACPKWSKDNIVSVIQRMHRLKRPLNSNHIQMKETRLYGAALKYFGGWSQAIAAAGLDYSQLRKKAPMRSWSKAAIVQEVIRRAEVGLSIRGADVYLEDRGLYQAAKRHFGKSGWARARVLAGFDPTDPRPWTIWNRETVSEEIKRLHRDGVSLNTGALKTGPYSYIHAAGRLVFGSWAKAVEAAGLNYQEIMKGRYKWWTKAKIVTAIQNLEKQGVRLSSKSMHLTHGDVTSTAIRLFGSWSQAVEAAGINYRKHCRIWSTKAWLRRMSDAEYKQKIT